MVFQDILRKIYGCTIRKNPSNIYIVTRLGLIKISDQIQSHSFLAVTGEYPALDYSQGRDTDGVCPASGMQGSGPFAAENWESVFHGVMRYANQDAFDSICARIERNSCMYSSGSG